MVCGHCLVTLSFTINETLKWPSSLSTLMQESFWWCSDRYIISLFPHHHTPSPLPPSLISLVVSVDVKHHVYVYFSRERRNCANREAKHGSNEVKWIIFCFSCSQQLILWTLSLWPCSHNCGKSKLQST